jgi:hypothetical protein
MKTVLFAYIAAFAILAIYVATLVVRIKKFKTKHLSKGDK